ncbi:MAG TPA: 23S rRNA (pseudouridine(1915)-N(3))-methyltransferase RlmH [Stellaceae bacterium]|nr:23S rRNA (pseudouridine(1915)-N(3))-methyltransferase RlmH [Stellaceae bacterium]
MRVLIAAVGRAKGPHLALQQHYAQRIHWPLSIVEVEERRPLPAAERCRREGALLLAALPERAAIVALDEHGTSLASAALPGALAKWRDAGGGQIAFLIGGADGLDEAVLARAQFRLALGPMTWPHLLVRGLLLEQLYRAQQIMAGHPYHRK